MNVRVRDPRQLDPRGPQTKCADVNQVYLNMGRIPVGVDLRLCTV
jgi:hypothetical protein